MSGETDIRKMGDGGANDALRGNALHYNESEGDAVVRLGLTPPMNDEQVTSLPLDSTFPNLSPAPTSLDFPSATRLPTIPIFEGPPGDLPSPSLDLAAWAEIVDKSFGSLQLCDASWLSDSEGHSAGCANSNDHSTAESGSTDHSTAYSTDHSTAFFSDSTASSANTTFNSDLSSCGPCTPSTSKIDLRLPGMSRGLGLGIFGLERKSRQKAGMQGTHVAGMMVQDEDDEDDDEEYCSFRDGIERECGRDSGHSAVEMPFYDHGDYEVDDVDDVGTEGGAKSTSKMTLGVLNFSSLFNGSGDDPIMHGRPLSSIPECDSWFELADGMSVSGERSRAGSSEGQSDEAADSLRVLPGAPAGPLARSSSLPVADKMVLGGAQLRDSSGGDGYLRRTSSVPKSKSRGFLISSREQLRLSLSRRSRSVPSIPRMGTSAASSTLLPSQM